MKPDFQQASKSDFLVCLLMVCWPNGKASDYESGDCRFEPCMDNNYHCLLFANAYLWCALCLRGFVFCFLPNFSRTAPCSKKENGFMPPRPRAWAGKRICRSPPSANSGSGLTGSKICRRISLSTSTILRRIPRWPGLSGTTYCAGSISS